MMLSRKKVQQSQKLVFNLSFPDLSCSNSFQLRLELKKLFLKRLFQKSKKMRKTKKMKIRKKMKMKMAIKNLLRILQQKIQSKLTQLRRTKMERKQKRKKNQKSIKRSKYHIHIHLNQQSNMLEPGSFQKIKLRKQRRE